MKFLSLFLMLPFMLFGQQQKGEFTYTPAQDLLLVGKAMPGSEYLLRIEQLGSYYHPTDFIKSVIYSFNGSNYWF